MNNDYNYYYQKQPYSYFKISPKKNRLQRVYRNILYLDFDE